jgi:hypothetical protein
MRGAWRARCCDPDRRDRQRRGARAGRAGVARTRADPGMDQQWTCPSIAWSIWPTPGSSPGALADRARLSGAETGTGPGTRRGARLARLPSSRHAVHRRLCLPDRRAGEGSPLSRRQCRRSIRDACRFPKSSAPNDMSQTRSRRCADTGSSPSQPPWRDVRAVTPRAEPPAPLQFYDAVRLCGGTTRNLSSPPANGR